MGVCINSFNYSCSYVSNCISDLLLVEVWRRFAILDSDVFIDVLSAVRQEKERIAVGAWPLYFHFPQKPCRLASVRQYPLQ